MDQAVTKPRGLINGGAGGPGPRGEARARPQGPAFTQLRQPRFRVRANALQQVRPLRSRMSELLRGRKCLSKGVSLVCSQTCSKVLLKEKTNPTFCSIPSLGAASLKMLVSSRELRGSEPQ